MVTKVTDLNMFRALLREERAVLFYFATLSCSVGEALEPKVKELLSGSFPEIRYCWVDMGAVPEVAAANQAFAEPTILLFVDGKESLRRSRHISMAELSSALDRIYGLAFGE